MLKQKRISECSQNFILGTQDFRYFPTTVGFFFKTRVFAGQFALAIFLSRRKRVRCPPMKVSQLSFQFSVHFYCTGTGETEGKTALPPSRCRVPLCVWPWLAVSTQHQLSAGAQRGTSELSCVAQAWNLSTLCWGDE